MKMIPAHFIENFITEMNTGNYDPECSDLEMLSRLIRKYHPERPCQYRLECIETSRCPKEISCDN